MAYERKLPTTGYWIFVCNTTQWNADEWLALGEDTLFYRVSNHHHSDVRLGQLGVLRLNKDQRTKTQRAGRPKLEAGIYAIFEVIGRPVLRKDADHRFYNDTGSIRPRWQVQVRVIANLLHSPVLASSLPNLPEFKYIKGAIQTSTIAISKEAFEEIRSRANIKDITRSKPPVAAQAESSYFEIFWKTGVEKGFLDQIPVAWFEELGIQKKRTHSVVSPQGTDFSAACTVHVSNKSADLIYDQSAENDHYEISLGTLRLHFASEKRGRISRIEWKDQNSRSLQAVEAYWELIDLHDDNGPTMTKRSINTRLGQAKFRERLKIYWEGRCAVTGIAIQEMLRASHIKPWADCTDNERERTDPKNGLLLVANLDALFDAGKISFSDAGNLLLHPTLREEKLDELEKFDRLSKPPKDAQREYLKYHRSKYGY